MEKAGTGMRHMFKDCIRKKYSAGQEKLLGWKKPTRHTFLLLLKNLCEVPDGCQVKELNFNLNAHSVHLLHKNNRIFNTCLSVNGASFFSARYVQTTMVIPASFVPTWLPYLLGLLRPSNNTGQNPLPADRSNLHC